MLMVSITASKVNWKVNCVFQKKKTTEKYERCNSISSTASNEVGIHSNYYSILSHSYVHPVDSYLHAILIHEYICTTIHAFSPFNPITDCSLQAFVFHEDDKLKVFQFEARSVVCG